MVDPLTDKRIVPVYREIADSRLSEKGIWHFGSRFNLKKEIFIAMSPTNYHCFIISGDFEFHPRFSFNPVKLIKPQQNKIRAGMFFRLKGIPQTEIEQFQRYLPCLKSVRSPSCHIGVIDAINNGLGIKINNIPIKKISPSDFFTCTLKNGLVNKQGEAVEFELYLIKNKTIDNIMEEIIFFENKFSWIYIASDIFYFLLRFFLPKKIMA